MGSHQVNLSKNTILSSVVPVGKFTSRSPTLHDFEKGDFTNDTSWNDIDLSSIIPSAAVAVVVKIRVQGTNTSHRSHWATKGGDASYIFDYVCHVQVANIVAGACLVIPVDDQKISARFSIAPNSWSLIELSVVGWFE